MKKLKFLSIAVLSAVAFPALAEVGYLKCELQTTFHKPWLRDTEWIHVEGKTTKYFAIDHGAKTAAVYNSRRDIFVPICSSKNTACITNWSDSVVTIDAMQAPDDPVPPHIDFRRSLTLTDADHKAHFVIADFGESKNGNANMNWTFDGDCQHSDKPSRSVLGATSPTYQDSLVKPISQAEVDRAWATRKGNTMTGASAGGRAWFHMWAFDNGLVYTGDGWDITAEGSPRQMYIGKDAGGAYRLCEEPIPASGAMGCYPWPNVKVGDTWSEQDRFGEAQFTLMPGRQ